MSVLLYDYIDGSTGLIHRVKLDGCPVLRWARDNAIREGTYTDALNWIGFAKAFMSGQLDTDAVAANSCKVTTSTKK